MNTPQPTDVAAGGLRFLTDAPGCVAAGPYSLAVQSGGLMMTSGQIGLDPATKALVPGGFEAEVRQIFRNMGMLLQAAGLDFSHVAKCSVYLTDVSLFPAFNDIYRAQFTEPFPARTTIGVAALPLGAMVEVEMIVHPFRS